MKLTRDPNNRHGNLSPLYKIQICSLLNKEIKHIMMFIMKIQRQLDLSINSENEDSLGKGNLIK